MEVKENQSMENRSSKTQKKISELPDVIIQHIQSFLETKEAAGTILISKSWLQAWSTRPFLDFDSNYLNFHIINITDTYSDFINRTIENYVDQGTPIAKLRLHVYIIQERWVQLVLRHNNVMELDLSSSNSWLSDMNWREIFLTKSLQVLRVNHPLSELVLNSADIKCQNLKKLQLRNVHIDCVTFQHIMCSCPLIEELLVSYCEFLSFRASNLGIQSFKFTRVCESLKRLSLVLIKINDEQLEAILSKSPHLEDLSLIHCYKLVKPVNLSSHSLMRLHIGKSKVEVVLIDVPNLRKLKYRSTTGLGVYGIPFPITIKSPKIKASVKFSIGFYDSEIDELWFHGLRDFLAKFEESNVKFTLYYSTPVRSVCHVLRATPLPCPHKVGTLKFKDWFKNPTLLYAFITICHPKIVLLGRLESHDRRASLKELYNNLSYRGNLECCKMGQNKCWRYYIKDAKLYYMADNEQKPFDMNGLDRGLGNGEAITLAIEWESSD